MTKEEVYDAQIVPLIEQVYKICKEHGIAIIVGADLSREENELRACTTISVDENGKNGYGHSIALGIIRGEVPNIITDALTAAFSLQRRMDTDILIGDRSHVN